MFLTINDGATTININAISTVEWDSESEATIELMNGKQFIVQDEDYDALKALIG